VKRLFLLAGIWGWSFLFIKVSVKGLTPVTVAATRITLGMVVLVVFLRARGLRLPRERIWWRHFTVIALVSSAIPFTLLAWGEQRISSALASVLNASTPLFTALIGAAFEGERLRPFQLAGLVLGFVGVGVAAGLAGGDVGRSSLTGGAAAVGAAVSYAVAFIYARRHLVGMSPVVAAAGHLLMGTVLLLPFAVLTSAGAGIHLTLTRTLAIVLLGVFGTGVAYILNYRTIADLGPTRASVVTYVIPVVAVAVGVVFLGEAFRARLVVGGVLTVLGIALLHGRLVRASTRA